jgi:hypothetical protein
MFSLPPPRHISTLHLADLPTDVFEVRLQGRSGHSARVSFGLLMTVISTDRRNTF